MAEPKEFCVGQWFSTGWFCPQGQRVEIGVVATAGQGVLMACDG